LHDGGGKKEHRRHSSHDHSKPQLGKIAAQHDYFCERGQGEHKPPGHPQPEIAIDMIALEDEKEDQQNNERRRFEESDAEQALVHQHDALPPDLNGRRPDIKTL
jgi:hypothetical protein